LKIIKHFLIFLPIVFFLSGCLGTRYLKEDEKLLVKQKIDAPKNVNSDELSQLFVQYPNRQIPIIRFAPYVWFYYHGLERYDVEAYRQEIEEETEKWTRKIAQAESEKKIQKYRKKRNRKIEKINQKIDEGNIWMKWGEPLSVYDTSKTASSMARLKLYLQAKGYFQAEVDTLVKEKKKRVSVTYEISPGPPYVLDSLLVITGDPTIAKIIEQNKDASLLVKGQNYEQNMLTKERERLDLLLKDNGYFSFSRQYIEFQVDTAFTGKQKVTVITNVNNPANIPSHKQFRIDSINFVTNTNQGVLPMSSTVPEEYNGIQYIFIKNKYNKKVLDRRIFLEKDSLYSRNNTFNTQRQLANLDVFRFININYDSTGGKLVANIFTSPLPKFQITTELGVNVTQGFPGPFLNLSFKKRNVFGGMEIFEISGRIGFEGVAPATAVDEVYTSIEGGVNASLTFPQFILPLSADIKRRLGNINPKTRLATGYNYTDRPEYRRENINASLSYTWQSKNNRFFQFTPTDIGVIQSTVSNDFQSILDSLQSEGNNIVNTFNPSYVSSMYLSATWNTNSYGLNFINSSFFRLFLESGGTFLSLYGTDFLEQENLEYYQFVKINTDFRKIHPINRITTLAWRINLGVAKPYGDNGILPYEKYFFAGGSNGIRAWRPRRLGPGSFVRVDSSSNTVNYDVEQPGTILLEGSIEWRQNLIGFLDYAWFIDFGNVWNFNDTRSEAEFRPDTFFRQIAVGSGVGLRLDFSFLILRLDAGVKIYDPARAEGKRFILSDGFYDAPFTRSASETVIFNIGIGYPF
jgi:outer membrane protein assembly factor BamA